MKTCGLEAESYQLIRHCSKGYRQRVALAQALMGDPQILILDEPTAGLDLTQLEQMRQLIKDLSRDRLIIFSTHILQEVVHSCNRVLMLSHGKKTMDVFLEDLERQHPGLNLEAIVSKNLVAQVEG